MSRDEVETNQRERLMDAFVRVVAEDGYEAAVVRSVCSNAGIAPNTFYDLFGSKDALFLAAYDAGVAVLFENARHVSLSGDLSGWQARVEAGLGSFLDALADNPLYARFFAVEIHKASAETQERVDEMFEAAFALFGRARVAADMGLPPEHLGPLIIGGIYTRIYFYIRTGRTADLPELLPVLTRFVLVAFNAGTFAD